MGLINLLDGMRHIEVLVLEKDGTKWGLPRESRAIAAIFDCAKKHFRQASDITIGINGIKVHAVLSEKTNLHELESCKKACEKELLTLVETYNALASRECDAWSSSAK